MTLAAPILTWLAACGLPPEGWEPAHGKASHLVFTHVGHGIFLKQFRQLAQYRRECNALAALKGRLTGVPVLIRYHEGLQVTVTAAATGTMFADTPAQNHPVWAATGDWLARLHAERALPPLVETDALPLPDAVEQRATRLLAELARQPEWEVAARFERALQSTCWPAGLHERVPCHRDFEPRNWLWASATSELTVVDFEHMRADAAAFDMVKVLEVCESTGSECWSQFLSAYRAAGATEPDPIAIRTAFVHHAAFTWLWGLRHLDGEWVQRGLLMLARVERGTIAPD